LRIHSRKVPRPLHNSDTTKSMAVDVGAKFAFGQGQPIYHWIHIESGGNRPNHGLFPAILSPVSALVGWLVAHSIFFGLPFTNQSARLTANSTGFLVWLCHHRIPTARNDRPQIRESRRTITVRWAKVPVLEAYTVMRNGA
jgi:hypothetical protein